MTSTSDLPYIFHINQWLDVRFSWGAKWLRKRCLARVVGVSAMILWGFVSWVIPCWSTKLLVNTSILRGWHFMFAIFSMFSWVGTTDVSSSEMSKAGCCIAIICWNFTRKIPKKKQYLSFNRICNITFFLDILPPKKVSHHPFWSHFTSERNLIRHSHQALSSPWSLAWCWDFEEKWCYDS